MVHVSIFELSCQCDSSEYPQHMILCGNKVKLFWILLRSRAMKLVIPGWMLELSGQSYELCHKKYEPQHEKMYLLTCPPAPPPPSQWRLISAFKSAQFDQSALSAWRNLCLWLSKMCPVKILIRLCQCYASYHVLVPWVDSNSPGFPLHQLSLIGLFHISWLI